MKTAKGRPLVGRIVRAVTLTFFAVVAFVPIAAAVTATPVPHPASVTTSSASTSATP